MPQISENRLKSLLAAEAVCQTLRMDISEFGGMTARTVAYQLRWLSVTGKSKYAKPKPLTASWCGYCRKRHKYGACESR